MQYKNKNLSLYRLSDITTMKFATEQDSIDYIVNRLKSKGWANIKPTQSTDKYAYYDIEAEYKGVRVRLELKRRNYNSDYFGDAVCESWKYNKFVEGIKNGEFDKGYLISLFNDKFTIDDITYPYTIDELYANKTTDFENRNIVKKEMCHYKQEYKYDY